MDAAILSRIQFAMTITFHILFPTLNIGLGLFILAMETTWLKTNNPIYLNICKYWNKIFALTFGMGVVSGMVLAYELGTNFGIFTDAVGEVLGPLFGYEVLSAFFLEAGFIGIMLFGWNRVGKKAHWFATLCVVIGTVISAFWILSANSWMQTPAGFELIGKHFRVLSWLDVIFNPSVMARFLHMVFASLLTTSFVIAGISAWYLLRNRHQQMMNRCFSVALYCALIFAPIQIFIGDTVGLEVHKYQPIKTAAMEANWHTQPGAPFVVFAYPDQTLEENRFAITIPKFASIINTHHIDGVLTGLDSVPPGDRPFVAAVFYSFRVMLGLGGLFLLIALYAFWLRLKGQLYTHRFLQQICVLSIPLGFICTIAGWFTAEIGRQPWIVYQLLRTEAGASVIPAYHVMISLAVYSSVYTFVFIFYLYYLFKLIRKGPTDLEEKPLTIGYATHLQHDGDNHHG